MDEQANPIDGTRDAQAAPMDGTRDVQPPAEPDIPSVEQQSKDAIDKIIKNMRDKVLVDMILSVENEKTRKYILSRVVPQMDYYSLKSRENKKGYARWMTTAIVLGALIPVLSVMIPTNSAGGGWVLWIIKFLIAALGAGVTAVNAYMGLHNFKELWTTYRNAREALLRTLYAYFNNAEAFAKKQTQEERDALLIKRCEDEIANENGSWRKTVEE
jgi:hypothetical protein